MTRTRYTILKISVKINQRIISGNKTYFLYRKHFTLCLMSKSIQTKLYKTVIHLVVAHAAEIWTILDSHVNALRCIERKMNLEECMNQCTMVRSPEEE